MIKIIRSIIGLLIVFGIGYLFGLKGVKFYEVISRSMEPTLTAGDKVIAIKPENLKRKDIVVIKDPEGKGDILTKRIIGLPGEKIVVKKGNVYINNVKISEPYIKEKPLYVLEKKIPENHYFLLGDNRNDSEDSSVWGPVEKKLIIGKVILRYYPFKKIRLFLEK
ncbi:signal peptidase I [bacterium]|nr:signal peptidase I [bacterium]